jgi:hypothetical protein
MKKLQIDNQTFDFTYSESAKCFMATEYINEVKVNFEIYEEEYNQDHIDWDYFSKFLADIKKNNNLPSLINRSQKLLIVLAETFGSSIDKHQNIEDYHMIFSGLQFKGSTNNLFNIGLFDISLWFNILNKTNPGEYVDPYGAYIADIEGDFVMGVRRRQC